MKAKIAKAWKALPGPVRKTIVLVVGSTLIIVGSLLVVLPGRVPLGVFQVREGDLPRIQAAHVHAYHLPFC